MGTRSLTHFVDSNKQTILTLYRHYDGYPSGHGKDLEHLIDKWWSQCNGFEDFVAMCISELKTEPYNFYIYPPNSKNCGEEYTYTVSLPYGEKELKLTIN